MFKSLKIRIILSNVIIVFISITIIIIIWSQKNKDDLYNSFEENAINMLDSTNLLIKSEYDNILYHKSVLTNRRKIELTNNTDIAISIIENAYKNYSSGILSEEDAKKQALNTLKELRYDNGIGYFWINDTTLPFPTMVMHPISPELDGTVLDSENFNKTSDNENLFKAFVDISLKDGDGFVEYLWPKPTTENLVVDYPKLSYVKLFKPWNWIIGTGVYIDDIEKDVQDKLDSTIEYLGNNISDIKIGKSGYFFIFSSDNQMVIHPLLSDTDGSTLIIPNTLKPLLQELKTAANNSGYLEYKWNKPENPNQYIYDKKVYISYFEPLDWYFAWSIYLDDLDNEIQNSTTTIIYFAGLFLLISIIVSLIITSTITRPLKYLVTSISDVDDTGIPKSLPTKSNIYEINILQNSINTVIEYIKESRLELKSANLELQRVLDSATSIAIISTTPNGIIKTFNTGAEKILKYEAKEVINIYTLLLFHSESEVDEKVSKLSAEYNKKINRFEALVMKIDESISEEHEWTLTRKDGVEIQGFLTITAIKEKSKIIGYLGIITDITKRKLAEDNLQKRTDELAFAVESLKKQEESLEELVKERTLELEESIYTIKDTQKQLIESEKMASLGSLVAGVAHEINTPVGSGITLASYLETITKKITEKFNSNKLSKKDFESFLSTTSESSKMILFNLKKAGSLIQSFKNVAVDQTSIDKRIFNLKDYLDEILNSFGDQFKKENIRIIITCDSNIMLNGSPGSLYRVITNFLVNSLKHGFENSKEGIITIEATLKDSNIKIIYKDNGQGMNKENTKKIFEPFFTTKRGNGGTGLGMSIVYNIIKKTFNGSIICESDIDKGTTFIINFPHEI